MDSILRGRAWVFPGAITTDDILPGKYLDRSNDEVAQFVLSGISPDFARDVQAGDFIVGGGNFGAGSGRESAPYAIRNAGVAAVIAPSFGRVFFRNCINIGLPAVIVDDIAGIDAGDHLTLDLERRLLTVERRDSRTGSARPVRNLTGISREILAAGGIVPYTKQRLALRPPGARPAPEPRR